MSTEYQMLAQAQVQLTYVENEPRVDSRIVAERLGNEHTSAYRLLTEYQAEFEEFGIIRFEIGESKGPGRPPKYALLNEDQCYLLLTYSQNGAKARDAKRALVHAFRQARDLAAPQSAQDLSPLDLFRQMLTAYEAQESRLQLLEGSQVELTHRLDDTPISAHADKERHIQTLIKELAELQGGGFHYRLAYGRFKAAFRLPGAFRTLRVSEYPAAVKLLNQWLEDARRDSGNLYN